MTGRPLPSWDDALDAIDDDPDARPAHVVRFGTKGVDVQGVVAGIERAGGCGKTLDEHRAERREHVMRALGAVGIRPHRNTPPSGQPAKTPACGIPTRYLGN